MNKEELKELLAHVIVDMHFTEGPVSRVKSELVNKVVDVVDKWYQEPVKPVLPKAVADELEDMKIRGASFAGYVSWFLEGSGTTYNWLVGRGVLTDDYVLVLSNAWYNGYTIEKELVYNLILGFDPDESDRRLCNALYKNHGELSIDAATDTYDLRGDDDYQFTQEEIDKYNKDFWINNLDLNDYKVEVEE